MGINLSMSIGSIGIDGVGNEQGVSGAFAAGTCDAVLDSCPLRYCDLMRES